MIDQCNLSERRACRLVGLSRDSYRNPPEIDQMTQDLHASIVEIAHAPRRLGASASAIGASTTCCARGTPA